MKFYNKLSPCNAENVFAGTTAKNILDPPNKPKEHCMAVGHQSFIVCGYAQLLSKVWVWCANGLLCNCHSQDTHSVLTGNNCKRYLFELEMFIISFCGTNRLQKRSHV